jgi:hypothetical protein
LSAALTVAEVRGRISASLVALGLVESTWVPEAFGLDPSSTLHRGFSVSAPASSVQSWDTRGRGPPPTEGAARSTFRVRMAHQVKGDAARSSYDAALDLEHSVLQGMLALDPNYLRILAPFPIARSVSPDGRWLLFAIDMVIEHRFALVAP